jgi:hypothetical protein
LPGGSSQKERKLRLKKKLEKKCFLGSFNPICILTGYLAFSLFGFVFSLFGLASFFSFYFENRSPASSVARATLDSEYCFKGQNLFKTTYNPRLQAPLYKSYKLKIE